MNRYLPLYSVEALMFGFLAFHRLAQFLFLVTLWVGFSVLIPEALAQSSAVDQREDVMKKWSRAAKEINRALRQDDRESIQALKSQIPVLIQPSSQDLISLYAPERRSGESEKEALQRVLLSGEGSARADLWQRFDVFSDLAMEHESHALALQTFINETDADFVDRERLNALIKRLGKSCESCHTAFRAKR